MIPKAKNSAIKSPQKTNSSQSSSDKVPLDLSKYPALAGLSDSEAKEMLWRRGSLSWKLDSLQKKLYRKFKSTDHLINVWNVSRQTGKTYALTILAIETCLSIPGAQVKYCSGDAKSVNKMIKPNIRNLLKECPPDIAPKWKQHGGHYEFPNGSLLYLEGIDGGKADSIRGTPAHLLIVDEAGFISDLEYAKGAVLIPMTTTTNGRILIVSTPPKSAGHDIVGIIKQAEYEGAYIKKTIYDRLEDCKNDHPYFRDRIPADRVEKIKRSTRPSDWEREYLCIAAESEVTIRTSEGEIKRMSIKELKRELSEDT